MIDVRTSSNDRPITYWLRRRRREFIVSTGRPAMQHELFGCSGMVRTGQQDHFRVAKAGEYLAAFELTAHGADVSLAVESRPYDLLVEFKGRVIRVQVKTASSPCDGGRYGFDTKRGSHKANAKSRLYTDDEVDMFALVAFDIKRVIFLSIGDLSDRRVVKLRPQQFMQGDTAPIALQQCVHHNGA